MKTYQIFATAALAVTVICTDASILFGPYGSLVGEAQARAGHPLTPGSAAGVARRTTRRVVRRSTIYVNRLPAACTKVTINGSSLWHCGGTYYQPSGSRYVVVYVN